MAIASYFLAAECVDRLVLVVLLGGNSALIRPPEELLHQFEDNSILLLPECLESSGVKSVWGEISQESRKNR